MPVEHLFVATDGALHDTRIANWSANMVRSNYSKTHMAIRSTNDFKATLRAGAYAWPGGYSLYLICSDGAALCFACGRREARNIIDAIDHKDGSGWRVLACDINYEDTELFCDHCSEQIESAYSK